MLDKKVVIVGAGLAGLYAAYLLEQQNIPYLLLEAQSRLGGRILGVSSKQMPAHKFDLGPTWIFPHQVKIQNLCKQLNLTLFPQYAKGDLLYQRSQQQTAQRMPGAGELHLLKILGGSQALISALYAKLNPDRIKLNHALTDIQRHGQKWQLTVTQNDAEHIIDANELMLAMPPRIIAQSLPLSSWLPQGLRESLVCSQTWMAGQAKFVVSYTDSFWREKGLSGQMFSQIGPLVETHDASTDNNQHHALFGFIGWPLSRRSQLTEQQLKQACLVQLVSCFGPQANNFIGCFIKDWATDHYTATAKDKVEPSRHSDFNLSPYLSLLREAKLHLIGSEFATSDPGYLEGAIDAVDFGVEQLLG